MRRTIWRAVLASALILSAFLVLVSFWGNVEASPDSETITFSLGRGYTLSFELPSDYQIVGSENLSYETMATAEGPPIEQTIIKQDGSRETSFYSLPNNIYFGVGWEPTHGQSDLSVLIRETFPPSTGGAPTWDWGAVYQEEAVNVTGNNGVTYPGYYALIYTEGLMGSQTTNGFLIVLVEPDFITEFGIYYGGARDYTLPGVTTYTFTVSGQPLVEKLKADVAVMVASVKIAGETTPTPAPIPSENTFTDSVPLPTQLSTDPEVIGTNVGLAILTVLIFYLAATIFNGTIKENYEIIEGWLRRTPKWLKFLSPSDSDEHKPKLRAYLEGAFVVAICALIYWFLNPYFTNGPRGIALFIALALGIAITTYSYDGTQVLAATRRFRVPAGIRIYPIAILIAIVFVALSNAINFHPGIIYGFVGAYAALSISQRLDKKQQGLVILYGTLAIIVIALGAFFLRGYLYNLAWGEDNFWWYLVDNILVAAIVIGLEGLAFSLALPLNFLDGGKLRTWKFWVWLVVALAVVFVFYYVIINNDNKFVEAARSMNVITMYILMGLSLLVSFGTWLYFKRRNKQQSASR